MANIPILENQLNVVAGTWDRHSAAQRLEDPRGMEIARFVFSSPYETDAGVVFDSALVWYNGGAVALVKRGLVANIEREAAHLDRLFNSRR